MNSRIMQYMMILAMTFIIYVPNGYAQHLNNSDQLSLSVGASVGYAPVLSFGDYDDSGTIVFLAISNIKILLASLILST
ncbi:MAG: hypothetical protein RI575_14430 [Balneolaceae bacterium]|nr:hypothetical protein [Balneolaceae bacterium]MDR9409251.1 hypothetical protein [Balneolaceae bacterium]